MTRPVEKSSRFWRHPDWPFEGRRAYDSAACYRAHTHPTLSIGVIDHGSSLLTAGSRQVELRVGDVVVIQPGEVHACNPLPSARWSYRMFYFDADWAKSIRAAGNVFGRPAFTLRSNQALAHLGEITRVVDDGKSTKETATTVKRVLGELFQLANAPATSRLPRVSAATLRAQRYLEVHADERVDLAFLAREVGLTPFQLIRRFKRDCGLTPHAYQLDRRVQRARELLRQPKPSLAEVAYSLGFADQSHFQRVFKTRVAATPAEYRGT